MNKRRRNVLLINPPSPEGTTANREGVAGLGVLYPSPEGFLYPAHTLASVASVLRQAGYRAMVLDMASWQATPLLPARIIKTQNWDSVIIFMSHVTMEYDLEFARFLRQLSGCPPITLVGPATRNLPPDLGGVPADTIILGEPEDALSEGRDQLLSWSEKGIPVIIRGPGCGLVEELDTIPYPAWDLVPSGKGGFLTVFGSKGCDRRCGYCPYVIAQGDRLRARSVDSIVEEVDWLAENFPVRRVMFRDIVFARDDERVVALCEKLLKPKRPAIQWECESHPLDFRPELLTLMRRAGCVEIKMGLETAHVDLLQRWSRVGTPDEAGIYLDRVASILQTCSRIGMRCRLFLMVGVPGQTQESVQATLSYLSSVRPRMVSVKTFHPYPGISMTGDPGDPGDASVFSQLLQSCQAPVSNGQSMSFFHSFLRLSRQRRGVRANV